MHLSQHNSPPFGGGEVTVRDGEVTVRGGVAPKVQTTSAKKRRQRGVMDEVVYVLGTTVPGLVCRSHANR